jgi:hypothetical protein
MNTQIKHWFWPVVMTLAICAFIPIKSGATDYKILKLNESTIGKIYLSPGRTTVLSFPMKPSKVIVGNQGSFSVQYVENDLALSPTRAGARSNLFVYVASRRFALDLISGQTADFIVVIRDKDTETERKNAHE